MELPQQVRSQMKFGNEGRGSGHLAILCGIFLLSLSSLARADITGTVTLQGAPNSKDETFTATAKGCGESPLRKTENWKVGPKGQLGDVVVWIVDPKFYTGPEEMERSIKPQLIEINQIGCRYSPHVVAVQAGIPFKIINGDPTIHNIRAKVYGGPLKPPGADVPGFNFGQTRQGQADEKQLDPPGIYTLQCDVHNWMQCWVMVLNSSCFGVTGTDGVFNLQRSAELADGDYKIDAWHPRFAQTLEQTIHVKKGAITPSAGVNFQFDGTKSF